jgi:hypothetical protein
MPLSQRNSIDTEGRVSTAYGKSVFGEVPSTRKITFIGEDNQSRSLELFQFRLKDHKFIVPDAVALRLYEAFGGFDLDDKVISDLQFIRDSSSARRLAAFVWRQPTGPQEFALMFPRLDEGTLSRLLGSETHFAKRFQALAQASSDLVSELVNKRIPTKQIPVTAAELDLLNREEKIIKYISLIAHGNKAEARRYIEGLEHTQDFFDEVERAIFQIMDIGQRIPNTNQGDTASTARMGLRLSERGHEFSVETILEKMGGENIIQDLDPRLIYIQELPKKIMQRIPPNALGSLLTLTPEEIADNPYLASQYRQSGFFKLFESKISIAEDDLFVKGIKNLITSSSDEIGNNVMEVLELKGSRNVDEVFKNMKIKISKNAGDRFVSDTEVAYRIAGKLMRDRQGFIDGEMMSKTGIHVANALNRQQFAAAAVDDGLAVYVNRLGFAMSLENQRTSAIEQMEQMLAENDRGLKFNSFIRERLNALKNPGIAIYSPEAAIDPSLAGGATRLTMGGTIEELMASVGSYLQQSQRIAGIEGEAQKAIVEGLKNLIVFDNAEQKNLNLNIVLGRFRR